ncbi:DHPS [Lepeophtheirus salmonis]|uniref:Deoxyhypusine synthase n=1 Tax=Lepeophtheirus salmonis TaxID=72036 RepID=A0A7R8D4H1_LEPSM|nr:DHPS [Lepeophtheirus salmonis]CAF3025559.1 DHPS [Lepeophtheirus salmonis]
MRANGHLIVAQMNTGIDTRTTEEIVLLKSEPMPKDSQEVEGYDFNKGLDYHALLQSYKSSGFQATNFGLGVDVINNMITCRNEKMPEEKRGGRAVCYTSNMASCGVRECIRYLVEHSMVDVIVASAGGIEEDFIKCLAPTYIGDFSLDGKTLRKKGINRIGNLLVPNDNYCKFEDWIMPIFDQMLLDQKEKGIVWTPSRIIHRLGLEINDPKSIYYWAAKNSIPVFSPALTDGSIGDMLYFHSIKKPGLVVDILQDLRSINDMSVKAVNTGMINSGRVFLNVANEFDGSDSGARPDEAISWGKIRMDAKPVKIYGEATLIFPLLMAETFVRTHLKL